MNKFEKAYSISGMTKKSVAAIANISRPTLDNKIEAPWEFTLNEYFTIWREVDDDGKAILEDLIEDIKAKNFVA